MRVGGYALGLYCDNNEIVRGAVSDRHGHDFREFPHQFYAETGPQCDRQARKRGWLIGPDKQLCPKCSGKRRAILSALKPEERVG